jgi:nucleotide-binding universal stress UspA family protein
MSVPMVIKNSKPQFKILWAVDPATDSHLQKSAITCVKAFTKNRQATVEPVYFLSTFLDSAPSQSLGDTIELTRRVVRQKFKKLIGATKVPGLMPLKIITGTDLSFRRMASELNDYAKLEGAEMIVLATHGRKGIRKWFVGSFAESVMQQASTVPILITNPAAENTTSILDDIIFPTDFSDQSKGAFLSVVDFAKVSHSRIILFHKISLTITTELHSMMMINDSDYKERCDREAADSRERAGNWAIEGERQGVKVDVFIDAQGMSSLAEAILKYQRQAGGIIAIAHLMGSTTHSIVQGTSSAVWVLPQTALKRTRKNAA